MSKKPINHCAKLADLLLQFSIDNHEKYSGGSAMDLYNAWVESKVIPSGLSISVEERIYLFSLAETFLDQDVEKLRICRAAQEEHERQYSLQ